MTKIRTSQVSQKALFIFSEFYFKNRKLINEQVNWFIKINVNEEVFYCQFNWPVLAHQPPCDLLGLNDQFHWQLQLLSHHCYKQTSFLQTYEATTWLIFHFFLNFPFLTILSYPTPLKQIWYNKSDNSILKFPLFGFYSGEKITDKNFFVGVSFSWAKLLIGEKYWWPLKNWSTFTSFFFHRNAINLSLWAKLKKRCTAQKMKFSIKDFFSKCDQIRRKLVTNIFCAVLGILNLVFLLFKHTEHSKLPEALKLPLKEHRYFDNNFSKKDKQELLYILGGLERFGNTSLNILKHFRECWLLIISFGNLKIPF